MSVEEIIVDEAFIKEMEQYRQPDKTVGLIEACSKNVIVFAERMLGLRLYSWQVFFLTKLQASIEKGNMEEFAAITSRQIGKSTALAILGLWAAVFNKKPGTLANNTVKLIVSASDTQSKKLLYEVKKFIRMGDNFMHLTYKDDEDKPMFGKEFFTKLIDEAEPNNTTTITFKAHDKAIHGEILLKGSKTGSVIKSYPPTSSVLGETATIQAVDEVGKTDKITDIFIYDFFYPVGDSTDAIKIYTSTPWVTSGFFYRIVDPDDLYKSSPVDVCMFTIEAIKIENPKHYATIMARIKRLNEDGKTSEVQRAYYCRFVKGEKVYFNPDRVMDVFSFDYERLDRSDMLCDMGIDFGGKVKSRTVITITGVNNQNKIQRIFDKVYEVGKDDDLIDDIAELMSRFNIQRIIPEDCPAGDYAIKIMEQKGWPIFPMNPRGEKVKKYGAFRAEINRKNVVSYMDDNLKTEMLALETTQGNQQSKIQHAPGYLDDRIDSFMMSAYFMVSDEGGFKTYDFYGEDK